MERCGARRIRVDAVFRGIDTGEGEEYEVFNRLLEKRGSFRLKSWLYRITVGIEWVLETSSLTLTLI